MLTPIFNPANWYWIIGESTSEVYSSARSTSVTNIDATYQAWLAAGNVPTYIDSQADLNTVLSIEDPAS